MSISIPSDNKHANKAEKARAQMEAAGVDPATISLIVSLILRGIPLAAKLIDKLFKHTPKGN